MALNPVRNYLHEQRIRQKFELRLHSIYESKDEELPDFDELENVRMIYSSGRDRPKEKSLQSILQGLHDKMINTLKDRDTNRGEAFEFYRQIHYTLPEEWQPSEGILTLPIVYHRSRVIETTDIVGETGYDLHPFIKYLIRHKYPHLEHIVKAYCRPLGTTKATFDDFNKAQYPVEPISEHRQERVIKHVMRCLDVRPTLPLHYVDTFHIGLPLNTGTGYHNRHSYLTQIHAKYFSHPKEYAYKPTSRGYYINAFSEKARYLIHLIKYNGFPGNYENTYTQEQIDEILDKFYARYPTMLFTRSHISKLLDKLKQRPVYAVDDLFIRIEAMLTFPFHVQARNMKCSIMYGLETFRGGCAYLDKIAQQYKSYFSLDWSSFDQLMPWAIVDTFFNKFLPKLIIVNKGYQPTFEYPNTSYSQTDAMAGKTHNLLAFLREWFYGMVFMSATGYAYKRTCAGIPSGLLNTQYLDSYCNLFIMIDALIEFGCTDAEITQIRLFVMGDDNVGFTNWSLPRLESFVDFLEDYALKRYHMILSRKKSIVTEQRQEIQVLSYTLNFGLPKRSSDKLIAQLCYPERGVVDKWMSYRAIGIAYASCGYDLQVYKFAKDVFLMFLPYAKILSPEEDELLAPYLPGQFRILNEVPDYLKKLEFPTIADIQKECLNWQGPLPTHPKCNEGHFLYKADHEYSDYITLEKWYKNQK
uniref:RNA-dependent RNA polymerase n=1 Tax=Soybean thrips partiti-like virus 8 TaxID=2801010 RepID=A0A7T8E824_9VIRU|nr:RNA-dependent RNA polymerase [Soybean thrips partiti-like virus 8]